MGRCYVRFARSEPNIFRLMFGQNADLKQAQTGTSGDGLLRLSYRQSASTCLQNAGAGSDPGARRCGCGRSCTGAACLLIDGDYQKIAPDLDVEP